MNPEPRPPQPPEIERHVILPPRRIIGVGLLLLFPILAAAGILGNHEASVRRSSGSLQVEVDYPDRLRYFTEQPLDVTIRNTGSEPKKATVRIDRDYLLAFTDESYVPDPERITQTSVEFNLGSIPPGETRRVQIELTAQRYGPQSGRVRIESDGIQEEFGVRTFVLP